jgi:alkylated DNA repair dioxygenase AlkB
LAAAQRSAAALLLEHGDVVVWGGDRACFIMVFSR